MVALRIRKTYPPSAVMLSVLMLAGAIAVAQDKVPAKDDGETFYRERCASCHDAGISRAPSRDALGKIPQEDIRDALTGGVMRAQGAALTATQIDAVSSYLSNLHITRDYGVPGLPPAAAGVLIDPCLNADRLGAFMPEANEPYWNGWGVDVTQRRFQPEVMAGLRVDQVPRLKLKWAFGYEDANQAYAQPTIVGGRIFVGSAGRRVYSINAKSGCIYWSIHTDFAVRTAITIGAHGDGWAVYFGDQHGNAYAVDAATGELLWKTRVDEHPSAQITGAPVLVADKLFVPASSLEEVAGADAKDECCKFRGSLSALDTATGKVIWKSYTIAEEPRPVRKNSQGVQLWGPSGAGIWSSPSVDLKNHMIYVTTGDNYSDPPTDTSDAFMALNVETGKLAWASQMNSGDAYNVDCEIPGPKRVNCPTAKGPDFDFGSSPILVELSSGRRALVAGAKSGIVYAVDPDHQGKLLWKTRLGHGGTLGGVQWGSAADTENVYVALSDVQRRAAPPGSPNGRDSVFGVPYELDPNAGGGLFALKLETGEIVWHTPHPGCHKPGCSPAQSQAVTSIPGVVFSGGVDGHLRAYSAEDGKIIWDEDTERDYDTVNGVKAHGGSLDAPGAVIVGGILYVNSGYFFQGSTAGNVLLAFSVDGK